VDKGGMPGITLYTSTDGAATFKAACLPVLIRVCGARTPRLSCRYVRRAWLC
jgi:hypothetical protein